MIESDGEKLSEEARIDAGIEHCRRWIRTWRERLRLLRAEKARSELGENNMTDEQLNTNDYRNAPSGEGPLANEWKDKPHRLVYDLCKEVDNLRAEATPTASRTWPGSSASANPRPENVNDLWDFPMILRGYLCENTPSGA
jgi:hypothetical protein